MPDQGDDGMRRTHRIMVLQGDLAEQVHGWAERVLGPRNFGLSTKERDWFGWPEPIPINPFVRVQSANIEAQAVQGTEVGSQEMIAALAEAVTRITRLREAGSTLFMRFSKLQEQRGGLPADFDRRYETIQQRWIEYVNQHPELRNLSALSIERVQKLTRGIDTEISAIQKGRQAANSPASPPPATSNPASPPPAASSATGRPAQSASTSVAANFSRGGITGAVIGGLAGLLGLGWSTGKAIYGVIGAAVAGSIGYFIGSRGGGVGGAARPPITGGSSTAAINMAQLLEVDGFRGSEIVPSGGHVPHVEMPMELPRGGTQTQGRRGRYL